MKISREEDYAVALVAALAQTYEHGFVTLDSIIAQHHLPERFVRGIASKLKNSGILFSKEGRSGGVMLARKPNTILLSEVLSAVGVNPIASHCSDPKHQTHCSQYNTCAARKIWEFINESLAKHLQATSIGQIEKLT